METVITGHKIRKERVVCNLPQCHSDKSSQEFGELAISISLDPLTSKRHWQTTNCHLLATEAWHWFCYTRTQCYVPQCNKCINVTDGYVDVWCAPTTTHVPCTVHTEVRLQFLVARVLVTLHFQTPLYNMYWNQRLESVSQEMCRYPVHDEKYE